MLWHLIRNYIYHIHFISYVSVYLFHSLCELTRSYGKQFFLQFGSGKETEGFSDAKQSLFNPLFS